MTLNKWLSPKQACTARLEGTACHVQFPSQYRSCPAPDPLLLLNWARRRSGPTFSFWFLFCHGCRREEYMQLTAAGLSHLGRFYPHHILPQKWRGQLGGGGGGGGSVQALLLSSVFQPLTCITCNPISSCMRVRSIRATACTYILYACI